MKPKSELQEWITRITAPDSPVGMDAVYVHALILDKLDTLERRIQSLESKLASISDSQEERP